MGIAAKGFAARKGVSGAMSLTFGYLTIFRSLILILSHIKTRFSARRQLLSHIVLWDFSNALAERHGNAWLSLDRQAVQCLASMSGTIQ